MGGLNLNAFLSKAIHLFNFCFKFWHLFGIAMRAKMMRIIAFYEFSLFFLLSSKYSSDNLYFLKSCQKSFCLLNCPPSKSGSLF